MNDRVKKIRKLLNLSQKEFADKLQITQAGLSKIELGGSTLTERNIKTICEKFNVNEDWLRNGNEPIFNNDYSNMNINERIKYFRTEISRNEKGKNYSQRQFADKIGVSHGVINNIESNLVEAKDNVIKLICLTFNVNEGWLRNGNEPIFINKDEDDIKKLKEKYKLDDVTTSILKTFADLDEFSKKNIINFLFKSIEDYYINNPGKLEELNNIVFNEKTKVVARGKGITYEDKSKIDEIIENSKDLNLDDIDFL